MVNSSLAYEILLYLNSFYFGMFAACEVGMGVLKGINMNYTPQQLQKDACILVAILAVETIRVYLGRKGSLSEHGKKGADCHTILHIRLIVVVFFLLFALHSRLASDNVSFPNYAVCVRRLLFADDAKSGAETRRDPMCLNAHPAMYRNIVCDSVFVLHMPSDYVHLDRAFPLCFVVAKSFAHSTIDKHGHG